MERALRRSFFAHYLPLLGVALATGCSLVPTIAYIIKPEDVPAEFDGLNGQRVVIIGRATSLDYSQPTVGRDLARRVGMLVAKNCRKVEVVEERELSDWVDKHEWRHFKEVGRAMKADMVVVQAHAGRRLAPWLLHLTDWELLRTCPVPVLVVKTTRVWQRPRVLAATDYEHLRPYLHSKRLRFSYGSDKGDPRDAWQARAAGLEAEPLADALERIGFAGLLVNRKAYADGAAELRERLAASGRLEAWESPDRDFLFVRLRPAAPGEPPDDVIPAAGAPIGAAR